MAASAVVELHPNVTGEFVQPGVGARAFFEAGRGDLDWTRSELELIARRYFGPLSLVAQAQAGIVEGNSPPSQRLFGSWAAGDRTRPPPSDAQHRLTSPPFIAVGLPCVRRDDQ